MTAKSIERNTEEFKKLPNDFQKAISESDYDNALGAIVKKFRLHIDQSAVLEDLLAKLIFDEIKSDEIIFAIEAKVNISREQALEIAKEVDQILIRPIKENLKKIQQDEK